MITAMKKSIFILLVFVGFTCASCERAFMNDAEPSNPVNVFDYLWNKVDQQ